MLFKGQTLGKYRVLSELGSGGFGTVYLAEDTWIDKKVALKVPHRQQLDFGELLHEPRLLASVNHPNIVSITTAEKQDNLFFIVMEYVPGETLEHVIARDGPMDIGRMLDYACQMCNAIQHAHEQGVLHRDLRPANVLVTASGVVKVADFGTSRFLEIAAHGTTVIGSPPYMAPEQFQGKAVFSSDLYSLGVTMYQMVTGVLPYEAPAPADLDRLLRGELTSPPRLRNPMVPKRLDDIIMKAMAPDIAHRYQRAADVLADLLTLGRDLRRPAGAARPVGETARAAVRAASAEAAGGRSIQREGSAPRFCWQCHKPLHLRTDRCPFCGETQ